MSVIQYCRRLWTAAAVVTLILACHSAQVHAQQQPPSTASTMERVRISENGTEFVMTKSGTKFVPWGFNFVGEFGRIVEEYWEDDWPGVEEDFRRMRALGANVVRLHLQVGTYMKTAREVEGRFARVRPCVECSEIL